MKVAFMGSDPIALPMLEAVVGEAPGGARLELVFTQPDRRSGRGQKVRPNRIKEWALERGLEVVQPGKCGLEEAGLLREREIDLVLVMAYGQILPGSILEAPRLGCVNLHASLLPRLRGASPIQTAVALGLPESGVSLMRVVPRMDAGPVADRERVALSPGLTASELHAGIGRACVPLVRRCLPALAVETLAFSEQDPAEVTYCRILEKGDAYLDFRVAARELVNRVRAFEPWPGTVFPHQGQEIRLREADAEESPHGHEPGTLVRHEDGGLAIACGRGLLLLRRLQRAGGKPLATEDFLRGYPLPEGTVLSSREMQPLEAPRPFPYRRKRNP
jgi:methionyl-tRNA formyltransferase